VKRQVAETTKDCCFSKIAGLYCSPMVATVLEFGEFTLDCGRFELCRYSSCSPPATASC
jgi:hypothetical protein